MKAVLFNPYADVAEFEDALRAFPAVEFVVAATQDDLPGALPGAEILITSNRIYTPQPAKLIREHGHALKWIQFVTSGIDKAVASGLPSGVTVTNVSGLRAFAVAEHAFALMLGLVRRFGESERAFLRGQWLRDEITPRMDNLAGKHLVIVGVGAIGRDIARKAKAFDMRVTGVSRSQAPLEHFDAMCSRDDLATLACDTDILMVAALADATTDKMISREIIAALPAHALIVNIARGSLIDEPALIEALRAHAIGGAGLDVQETEPTPPSHPLWELDNVLLTPHLAGAGSKGSGATHASMFCDNLKLWLAGKPLEKVVIQRTN